jgi:hypothetical protein
MDVGLKLLPGKKNSNSPRVSAGGKQKISPLGDQLHLPQLYIELL